MSHLKNRVRKYPHYFDTQDLDEKVLALLRRHPIALLSPIFQLVSGLALLPLARLGLLSIFPALPETNYYPGLALLAYFYTLLLILLFFINWIDYYLDVWLVTDRRIVNIEQKRLFNRQVSEQKIFRVQDVTSESVGLIPTLFKFGNVYIQTAGSKERFVFKQVPNPEKIKRTIIDIHDDLLSKENMKRNMHIINESINE